MMARRPFILGETVRLVGFLVMEQRAQVAARLVAAECICPLSWGLSWRHHSRACPVYVAAHAVFLGGSLDV